MGKVCKGGLYDGRPANAAEDAAACVENGGQVVDDSSSSCTSLQIAPLGLGRVVEAPPPTLMTELIVLPLRLVRNSLPNSPTMAALQTLNDGIPEDLQPILSKYPQLGSELARILYDASFFAGSMLQRGRSPGGESVFTPALYDRIVKASGELSPLLTNPQHQNAMKTVLAKLQQFVGKNASEVYQALQNESNTAY